MKYKYQSLLVGTVMAFALSGCATEPEDDIDAGLYPGVTQSGATGAVGTTQGAWDNTGAGAATVTPAPTAQEEEGVWEDSPTRAAPVITNPNPTPTTTADPIR